MLSMYVKLFVIANKSTENMTTIFKYFKKLIWKCCFSYNVFEVVVNTYQYFPNAFQNILQYFTTFSNKPYLKRIDSINSK